MSTNRIDQRRSGWVDGSSLLKDPDGRPLCRWCAGAVPRGRRTFCSPDCVEHHRIRTDPSFVRQLLFRRDHGVCAECGVDTVQLQQRCREVSGRSFTEANAMRRHYGAVGRTSWWDADHIVPVVEGGGECDLSNYRTLCIRCHQRCTAELARRRAATRKSGKCAEQLNAQGTPPAGDAPTSAQSVSSEGITE